MPTTRNQSSGSKATNDAGDEVSRSQSRNSTEGEKNNNSTEEPPAQRVLRDRASLTAKAQMAAAQQQEPKPQHLHRTPTQNQNQKQQQSQSDNGKTTPSDKDGSAGQKSKGLPPTRVLSRRSGFRPQSLLKKGSSQGGSSNDSTHSGASVKSNNESFKPLLKRPRLEESKVPDIGLDLTKRTVDSSQQLSIRKPIETYSRVDRLHNASASSSNLSTLNRERSSNAVRISLPAASTSSSSLIPSSHNGSQNQSNNQQFRLIPLGLKIASEMQAKLASSSTFNAPSKTNTSSSSHSDIQNRSSRANQSLLLLSNNRQTFNVLICVSGSVATVKVIELIRKLHMSFPQTYTNKSTNKSCVACLAVKVVMTEKSKHFVNKNEISKCVSGKRVDVYDDADEWATWTKMGDPVLHIELRRWADLCLIAPLSANTMAKLANGICDNLLTCVVRAWDTSKRLIFCPAMNSYMWEHPITSQQLGKLQSYGYLRVDCIEKRLACGDVGMGAMATVDTIVEKVVECLLKPVPRVVSPSKPLLNQQPTYQIMSTSDKPATSTAGNSGVDLIDRYKSNDPVNLRAINSSIRSLSASSNGASTSFPKSSTPQNTAFNMLFQRQQNQRQQPQQQQQPQQTSRGLMTQERGNDMISNNGNNKQGGSNLVQSLKNLKAINPDLSSDSIANGANNHHTEDYEDDDDEDDEDEDEDIEFDDDMDDYQDEGGLDLSSPEADNYGDLDPSRLLEQSLVEQNDSVATRQSRAGSTNSFGNLSSVTRNNFAQNMNSNRTEPITPFLNTSKFLSMCEVKERNCFNCAICKNDYKNRKSMSRHLREQHVQGNIYQCEPCGMGFKRREKLVKHNRDRHPEIAQNDEKL